MEVTNYSNSIFELHLELNIDEYSDSDKEKFKSLANLNKDTISRDVLVSSDITLNSFNYLIQRAFGFTNSFIHKYRLPKDVFDGIINNDINNYLAMQGLYLRMPKRDSYYYQDIGDLKNIKSLKHNMKDRYQNLNHFNKFNFNEFNFNQYALIDKYIKSYDKRNDNKFLDSSFNEIESTSKLNLNELLENRMLCEILTSDVPNVEEIINEGKKQRFIYDSFKDGTLKDEDNKISDAVPPLTSSILYQYAFFEIKITLVSIITHDDDDIFSYYEEINKGYTDHDDEILDYVNYNGPVCIKTDGYNLFDGVYNLSSLMKFLKKVDSKNAITKENAIEMASSYGWKKKVPYPKDLI